MSIRPIHVECRKCGMSCSSADLVGNVVYVEGNSNDSRQCPLHRELGFCTSCNLFRPVEKFDLDVTIRELDENRKEAQESARYLKEVHKGIKYWLGLNRGIIERVQRDIRYCERKRVELETYLIICEEREDKPKCLACGSTKVTALKLDFNAVPEDGTPVVHQQLHPICGGELEISRSELSFSFPVGRPTYYSFSGERLVPPG